MDETAWDLYLGADDALSKVSEGDTVAMLTYGLGDSRDYRVVGRVELDDRRVKITLDPL